MIFFLSCIGLLTVDFRFCVLLVSLLFLSFFKERKQSWVCKEIGSGRDWEEARSWSEYSVWKMFSLKRSQWARVKNKPYRRIVKSFSWWKRKKFQVQK